MIPYRVPPAGEPIRLTRDRQWHDWLTERCAPFGVALHGSGTAALAAALCAARRRTNRRRVLLPGYSCPALVSAALHAEMEPVPVDLAPERPWLDLDDLDRMLDARVAAVIGADLLGLGERWSALAERCRSNGSLLLQDSAQHFPAAGEAAGWPGDFAVLSFGRGKPVSLLGGGACLHRSGTAFPECRHDETRLRPLLETVAYNALLSPWLYWVPASLPLRLGETRYRPYRQRPVSRWRLERLPANADRPAGTAPDAIAAMVDAGTAFCNLPAACGARIETLLRYPLLAPTGAIRDGLVQRLGRWGVTALYGDALPWVPELPASVGRDARLPNARDFAARLVTLPLHRGVGSLARGRIARELAVATGEGTQTLKRREQP